MFLMVFAVVFGCIHGFVRAVDQRHRACAGCPLRDADAQREGLQDFAHEVEIEFFHRVASDSCRHEFIKASNSLPRPRRKILSFAANSSRMES